MQRCAQYRSTLPVAHSELSRVLCPSHVLSTHPPVASPRLSLIYPPLRSLACDVLVWVGIRYWSVLSNRIGDRRRRHMLSQWIPRRVWGLQRIGRRRRCARHVLRQASATIGGVLSGGSGQLWCVWWHVSVLCGGDSELVVTGCCEWRHCGGRGQQPWGKAVKSHDPASLDTVGKLCRPYVGLR